MRILEYTGLDTHKVAKAYRKVVQAIASRDFRAAQVKKLGQAGQGSFYRARLDDSNRLLFTLVRHGGEICALMLEVILNHDYGKSRFLRGASIDEDKIPDIAWTEAETESQPLASMRYLHPEHASVHLLDKPISFDDVQEAIYRQPAPLIVVGSAGSGKTALTLEKLKHAEGEVLYVTHSAFLAQSARDLYYANGFEQPGQEAIFLSYREFIESLEVPAGREALWRDFTAWFTRIRQAFKDIEAHQAFEEIRGVLTASAHGLLSREAYRALGVRQSIFPPERRDALYDLFEKYQAWLAESRLFDLNLVAQDWLARAQPRYDFVVVDEVQDLTPVQLALVLRTLKKPGHFLLCGDSNQIVHPNFFSWAQVKSLFWQDATLAERQDLRVLAANFRNGHEATRVANQLLKIKQRRFGSIDRESNYLVQAIGGETGAVQLLADKDGDKKALNQQIRQSTQFAVLVMRDEDKAEARQHFSTPLLFSIHEAKGLEYENIVLYRFVSDHRAEFGDIVEGVHAEDLQTDSLEYRRARDKSDKSLEVYKFFVNALYVALTRAIKNLYLIESDLRHPLFDLLEIRDGGQVKLDVKQSSLEEWQKEARKLELQGKQEQADAIRKDILKQATPPWPVFDQAQTEALMRKVFIEQIPGNKHKQQLLEIAACHNLPELANGLNMLGKFPPAQRVISSAERNHPQARFYPPRNVFSRPSDFTEQFGSLARKSLTAYTSRHIKEVLRQCDVYGLEHRLPMNQTPLMAAAVVGNVALVEALIARGADREASDHFGCNALHWAMLEAFRHPDFALGPFAALYDLLAPASIDINTGQRLVRIDKHLTEYFLLQTLWVLMRLGVTSGHMGFYEHCAFRTDMVLDVWEDLPTSVLRSERNKRSHLSNVLSRNEVERDYAYNRMLFKRVAHGHYQFNPALSVRRKIKGEESWVPVFEALNLRWLGQFTLYQHQRDFLGPDRCQQLLDRYLGWAQLAPMEAPIIRTRVRP